MLYLSFTGYDDNMLNPSADVASPIPALLAIADFRNLLRFRSFFIRMDFLIGINNLVNRFNCYISIGIKPDDMVRSEGSAYSKVCFCAKGRDRYPSLYIKRVACVVVGAWTNISMVDANGKVRRESPPGCCRFSKCFSRGWRGLKDTQIWFRVNQRIFNLRYLREIMPIPRVRDRQYCTFENASAYDIWDVILFPHWLRLSKRSDSYGLLSKRINNLLPECSRKIFIARKTELLITATTRDVRCSKKIVPDTEAYSIVHAVFSW